VLLLELIWIKHIKKQETQKQQQQQENKKEEEKPIKKEEEKKEEKTNEQKQAEIEKENGNKFYKNKDFENSIKCYDKSIELDPNNMIYRLNRAASYLEQGNTKKCISDCEEAIDVGRSNRAGNILLAKAYSRIGSAYLKENNLKEAIKSYKLSLTENRVAETLKIVTELELKLKKNKKKNLI